MRFASMFVCIAALLTCGEARAHSDRFHRPVILSEAPPGAQSKDRRYAAGSTTALLAFAHHDSAVIHAADAASGDHLVATDAASGDHLVATVRRDIALNGLGRYMSPPGNCRAVRRTGWLGFPTRECTYASGSGVTLRVILLDPSDAQLARWLVTACRDAHVRYVVGCAERVDLVTTCQSGAQFPVAGFVDEGDIFTFRDGVTTRMTGLPSTVVPPARIAAVAGAVFDGVPAEAKRFARISSTTREQFAAFVGEPASEFSGLAWLPTVRAEYQRAWGSDRNRLMSARVAASPATFDRDGWSGDFNQFCIDVAGCPAQRAHPAICARTWHPWPV